MISSMFCLIVLEAKTSTMHHDYFFSSSSSSIADIIRCSTQYRSTMPPANDVETIKKSLANPGACDSTIPKLLATLLDNAGGAQKSANAAEPIKNGGRKVATGTKTRAPTRQNATIIANTASALKPAEQVRLATEVVNICLKSLSQEIQAKTQHTATKPSAEAASTVLTTRSINVPSSPAKSVKNNVATQSRSGTIFVAECARLALAPLRKHNDTAKGQGTPALQVESAMSALISKLTALEMIDLACKEIRLLAPRLGMGLGEGPGTASKMQTISKSSHVQPCLASLLHVESPPDLTQKLSLVITTQLHILKVLRFTKSIPDPEELIKYLSLDLETSPAALIELAMMADGKEKCIRQLGTLAHAMTAVSDRIASKLGESASHEKDSHASILKLRALSLHVLWKSWTIASHKIEVRQQLCQPLKRHIKEYLSHTKANAASRLDIVSGIVHSMTKLVEAIALSKEQCNDFKSASLDVDLLLQAISKEAGDTKSIKQIAQQCSAKLSTVDMPGARRATILCLAATSMFQEAASTSAEGLNQTLEKAVVSYYGSIDGSSEELDELLLAISSLRKAVMKVWSQYDKYSTTERPLWGNQAIKCILSALAFALRYLGKPPSSSTPTNATRRHEARRLLAGKVGRATIESVVVMAKQSADSTPEEWSQYEQPLRDCLTLAEQLCSPAEDSDIIEQKQTPIPILVSNVHWYRYLALRQSGSKQSILASILEQSIGALESLPNKQQMIGLLPQKLERLGYIFEQVKDWNQASEIYQSALSCCARYGLVQMAAKKLRWIPIMTSILEDKELKILGKAIEGYCRVRHHVDKVKLQVLKIDCLTDVLHGFILELQLSCLSKLQHNNQKTIPNKDCIEELGQELLSLYEPNAFPIRRLRVASSLAACNVFTNQVSEASDDLKDLDPGERDLLPFHEHLIARNHALLAMHQMQQSSLLTSALGRWLQLISHKSVTTWQAIADRIGDVQDWQDLLRIIASFSEAHGLLEQRICALDLLAYSTKLLASFDPNEFVQQTSALASELIFLGFTDCGSDLIQECQKLTQGSTLQSAVSQQYQLTRAQLFLATDDDQQDTDSIHRADQALKMVATQASAGRGLDSVQTTAQIHFLRSQQMYKSGRLSNAVFYIKQSVRDYLQIWAKIDRTHAKMEISGDNPTPEDGEKSIQELSNDRSASFTLSTSPSATIDTTRFWTSLRPLFEALMYASELHLHCGLVTEARYYVVEALKISEVTSATSYMIKALAFHASLETKAGDLNKGVDLMRRADELLRSAKQLGITQHMLLEAVCTIHRSAVDGNIEDLDKVLQMLNKIKAPRSLTMGIIDSETDQLTSQFDKLKITKGTKKTSRSTTTKVTLAKSNPPPDPRLLPGFKLRSKTTYVAQLRDQLLRLKTDLLVNNSANKQALSDAEHIAKTLLISNKSTGNALTSGKIHLRQGLADLQIDPLLNIIPEAILAQPAVLRSMSTNSVSSGVKQPSSITAKRKRADQVNRSSHFNDAAACCDLPDMTTSTCTNTADAHSLGELSVKTFLTLAAVAPSDQSCDTTIARLGEKLEYGRNVASISSLAAVEAERMIHSAHETPQLSLSSDTGSLTFESEQFQHEFVDVIPGNWHVVSLSLSENCSELKLGTFRSATVPFVLSIPLSRESKDGVENAFSYEKGKKELTRIIDLANYSTHEAVDYTKRGAKAEWWEARAALDSRLRDLLANIEHIWLSGFKSMLLHCPMEEDLLNQFETSWTRILNKYLPSRQPKKVAKANHVALDRNILELFLRLGNPQEDPNIDEPILDLLYFVIDVLWFNGEQNSCDEIDFDPIVLDIKDALTSYHEAIKEKTPQQQSIHTILILDKRLHSFPWESLPCMKGRSVSRLPSLYALRRRVLQMQAQQDHTERPKQYTIDKADGTFILNPSGDLKNTQSVFEKPLSSLSTWAPIINTIPKEEQIATALSTKSLYLYFGHGSGGQYIRTRAIRRLNQCAVALLMGCSSGSLTEAGEFESHGTPLAYLNAGAPAVVGTLWDVTDKDIDRFSTTMLQRWGLLENHDPADGICETTTTNSSSGGSSPRKKKTAKAKGKQMQKQKQNAQEEEPWQCSRENSVGVGLDAAVAEARDSCIMRYLNGAAPVVYGIPVFLR